MGIFSVVGSINLLELTKVAVALVRIMQKLLLKMGQITLKFFIIFMIIQTVQMNRS